MSDHDDGDIRVCDCGTTFNTLDDLKDHAKENHLDVYEENLGAKRKTDKHTQL
jgi:hypothetical protein